MYWSLSFKTLPDETILEDSTKDPVSVLQSTYTVFLTNKRALFRFNGTGSSMTQSFTYQEITDVQAVKRLLIPYLCLKTQGSEYFLHILNPEYWSAKILEHKQALPKAPSQAETHSNAPRKRHELDEMIGTLESYNLLTREEAAQKKKMLERLQL